MKISNLLYMGALSTLTLMSCTNNDDNSEWYGSEGIVFTTAIQSRVSGNTWNANDEVGIYMMNAGSGIEAATAQNKKYIAQTNGTLTAAPGNGIYLPESGNVDFIAYYPYTTSVSGNKLAVNVSDQSNPAAIDLIYSNGTKGVAATTATTISLGFTHQLTKVTLNVTKDETIETLNGLGVNIKGISTEGEFNLADGTLTATAGTNNKDVAMYIDAQGTTATATAIILPTAASTDQTSLNLTFNLNGQSFTHTISDASIFEKGTNVSFNAKLSINNGKPVVTVGNATISNWTEKPGGDINVDFDGGTQPGGETVVLDESFATGMGQFTTENITLPEGGSYVWKEGKYQETTYIKAGAFINDAAREADSRLVSPTLDLTTATTATLTFDHAYNHYKKADNHESELTLEVKEENGDWTPIVIPNFNDGSTWTYVSNTIDLSAYAGKKMQFAFHYKSTTTNALGWQITKVKVVANGEGGGTVDPEPEPEPGNADLFISEYVEGSSNNKYIEIYNPTNETIDLSSYSLDLNTNGGESWSKDKGGFSSYELSGTIGAKSTIVYKHAEAAIFEGEATTCGAANFNGNDPVGLFKNGTLIDIVGKFANGSADFAKDVTLRRKSNVTSPSSTYDASQWETLSKDDVSGLGSHTMD
ncbi:fimbrillin family protein [Phocaeicola plebeius]|uniref:fimbrillin family protein n=1 Tax=Phocaeicola plebeius TaxID=310297 RepID=UPI0026F29941|nr:fimbrillin family protein [Phocaeicola plebeius]